MRAGHRVIDARLSGAPRFREALWPMACLFAASLLLLVFGLLASEVAEGETLALDRRVLTFLHGPLSQGHPNGPAWLQEMGRDVTAFGSVAFLAILTLAVTVFLLITQRRMFAAFLAASVTGGELISTVLKTAFARGRPEVLDAPQVFTASFPSGHAMLSAVTFLTLGALLTRTQRERSVQLYFVSLAVILTILAGLSRLYLGVHYLSDVLAGWCVGTAWATLCWAVLIWLERRAAMPEAPVPPFPDIAER